MKSKQNFEANSGVMNDNTCEGRSSTRTHHEEEMAWKPRSIKPKPSHLDDHHTNDLLCCEATCIELHEIVSNCRASGSAWMPSPKKQERNPDAFLGSIHKRQPANLPLSIHDIPHAPTR
ncbi:uncharacterized protein LOC119287923 [Triticum dicoccoides]|uniref:uncharacterized protein LOC119287923 n=1 Tax=Triticum dicoccoides TaxID=85692 RepID=UPI00188E2512|nr:uncharacterized protein LOC119287923 [Triticum dicoccoides]